LTPNTLLGIILLYMATIVGSGVSTKLDSFSAGKEAAAISYYQLDKYNPNVIISFISTIFNPQEVIRGIHSVIKEAPLIGCSSVASILTSGVFRNSVSVFTISSDSITFSCGAVDEAAKNPRTISYAAASEASNSIKAEKQAYLMFSDGVLGINRTDILRGAQELFGTNFPIIGGPATDNLAFQKTYQYLNNNVYLNAISGLLISGKISVGVGKGIGCQPIGRPHKITKAKSNIIKEIDKKVAIEIYEEYFEKSFEELIKEGIAKLGIMYPLGMRESKEKKDYIIRAPLKVGDDGSLILSAEMPEGENVSLMFGDSNLLLESTKDAAMNAVKDIKNKTIKFVIVFSDIGRFQLLKKDAQKEIEIIRSVIGKNIPILGCYTCGEYVPYEKNGITSQFYFNNQAISVAAFSE